MIRIVECGCCGAYHRADYFGECRDNDQRFSDEQNACERLGVKEIEVERFEYEKGEVVQHFVETYPGFKFVEDLPLE